MSFPPYLRGFMAKNQKILKVGKVRNYVEETEYFKKETLSSFSKASLTMLEGAK